jgi:glycerol-3-phosphate acyltransferase PlsY
MTSKWVNTVQPLLIRRLLHITVGLFIVIAALFLPETLFFSILVSGTLVFLLIELFRFIFPGMNRYFYGFFGLVLKESEISHVTGASYFFLGALISFVIFERDIAIVSVCFLAIGDTVSAIVSEYNGRIKLFKKTLEGNIACLLACLGTGFIFYFAGLDISLLVMIIGAVVATIIEALPLPVDDNITIPISAGLAMTLVQFWL